MRSAETENFIGKSESETFEFKSSLSQLERIVEMGSAFTHTSCGQMVAKEIQMANTNKISK